MKWHSFLFALFALFFLLVEGCSSDKGKNERLRSSVEEAKGVEMDTLDDPKAFLLPTPTQIPTYIYNATTDYHSEILLSPEELSGSPYKKEKATKLGGILVDAAYSGLHDDPARVKEYAKSIRKLSEGLSLSSLIEKERVERLKELSDQKAPLSKELLRFYQDVHKELKKEKDKKIGYYMVRGAFIEGLYLSLSIKKEIPGLSWERIIEQQRLYWENLRKLERVLFNGKRKKDERDPLKGVLGSKDKKVSLEKVQSLREESFY